MYRPPVTSAQWNISTEEYPASAVLLNFNDDDFSKGYGQIKEALRAVRKDDILKPYISLNDFRSSNEDTIGNDIGYNLYVFHIQYQKNFESAQPKKVEIKFSGNIAAGIYGYALVLTNKLIGISSDFVLIYV